MITVFHALKVSGHSESVGHFQKRGMLSKCGHTLKVRNAFISVDTHLKVWSVSRAWTRFQSVDAL